MLCDAVARAERSLVDADLGGGVIKQRIARPGAGRSRGYRAILLSWAGDRAVFAFGFAKSAQENIGDDEVEAFRRLAGEVLALSQEQLDALVKAGKLVELRCDDEG